jgi:hypothetical protein
MYSVLRYIWQMYFKIKFTLPKLGVKLKIGTEVEIYLEALVL